MRTANQSQIGEFIWESSVDNNVWETGATGMERSIGEQ